MEPIPVIVITVYLVGTTLIGSTLAKRARSAKDWAVAGGGMGTLMIAVGIAGTRIGGAGTYGVAGNVITGGTWYAWWYGISTILALALMAFFYAIPYRRLELQTVGGIFPIRFGGNRCQILTSLCVQTEYFIIDIIEAYLIASIISSVTGWPFEVTVFIAAAVLITYTALGGLWGSAATNLIHCIVIVVGLLSVAILGMRDLGGWAGVQSNVTEQLASASIDEPNWWSWIGTGWTGMAAVVGLVFSTVIHTPAASIYVNFSTAAKNEKIIVPAFLIGGMIATIMPLLAGWIGVETLAKYGAESGLSSYANITKLATDIHPLVGSIALAAVLAAVISSGGPILLASATMFVQDWMPFTRNYEPKKKLRTFRIATITYGLVAAIAAIFVGRTDVSLLDLLLFGFAMVCPPAISVGYLIYWKRTTEAGAFWGTLLGYAVGLAWWGMIQWATGTGFEVTESSSSLAWLFHACFVSTGKGIDPSYPSTLIPLVAVPLISLVTRPETERGDAFYSLLATGR
jgi:SSS family solute:Na+ symporter